MIEHVHEWFVRAVPTPIAVNQRVQLGVHFEEVAEQMETLQGVDSHTAVLLANAVQAVRQLSSGLKAGSADVVIVDREGFLDACCDQIVTATGTAYVNNMKLLQALHEVDNSNWSKFDDGVAVFDANGKIAKNKKTYFKANLTGMY